MRRTILIVIAATIVAAGSARAQESPGAGRIDITVAPVGGMFFGDSSTGGEPDFGNYALAGSATWNLTPHLAVEGEFGSAVGVHQDIQQANGVLLRNQSSPCLYQYNANLIVHPTGSDRAVAPYVAGGIGGLTLLGTDEVEPLGIDRTVHYLSGNVGGGVKWFVHRRWGIRADYRVFAVRSRTDAPAFFGRENVRFGRRIYGGLILNY